MRLKHDIQDRLDVQKLVHTFYSKVNTDAILEPYFNEIVKVNWDDHLPKMVNFWENILFGIGNYSGNPMKVHQNIHSRKVMDHTAFMRWLDLFHRTVNEHFEGENAERIKQRAQSIATLMEIKVNTSF